MNPKPGIRGERNRVERKEEHRGREVTWRRAMVALRKGEKEENGRASKIKLQV